MLGVTQKKEPKYRHEFKYEINSQQLIILENRLNEILKKDSYVGGEGNYLIRSLYFDNYINSGYYDNENGYDPREKFRIRIYNASQDKIRMELKRKESGMTQKYSCPISKADTERLLSGQYLEWKDDMPQLLKKFYIQQRTQNLLPKVIVEYRRIPFVYPDGNVRITLDIDICASGKCEDFFEKSLPRKPIMPRGRHLLEVKYDEFLPDFIKHTVDVKKLEQTTFSKYYLCRKFGGVI